MSPTSPPESLPVAIVGAGQAGLAMSHALLERGLRPAEDFVILDAGSAQTLSWRRRWDSLTLFTPTWHSHLPGLRMPGAQRRYPSSKDVADYLDLYRASLGVEPKWDTRAVSVHPQRDDSLMLQTSTGSLRARAVVAATGPFAIPQYPGFANDTAVDGANLHSDAYRNPDQLPRGPVLVVGSGNTGIQIARELSAHRCVSIAQGSPQPRLPHRLLGVDLFRWLQLTGVLSAPSNGRIGRRISRRELVVGPGLVDLASRGVHLLPRAVDGNRDRISFADGVERRFESVIWATGYRNGFGWLPEAVVGADGTLDQQDGRTPIAGLYVLGDSWLRNRGSALLGGVGTDARLIARHIVP